VRSLDTDSEHTIPLGSGARFSDDGRWVAYYISLPFQEAERARREDDRVTRKAELLDLSSGEKRQWDEVASFAFAKGASHLLVRKERPEGGGGSSGERGRAGGSSDQPQGTDVILRNLEEGYDELIGSVADAEFNRAGTHFAYTVDAADQDGNGLYLVDLATGSRQVLDNAKERYANLTWSEEGDGLAVLRGKIPDKKTERVNTLLAFTALNETSPTGYEIGPDNGEGLPDGSVISEKGGLTWSEGLETIFVGLKDQEDELEDWPEDALPLADVNIWHWADEQIQTVQMRQASRERNRTFLAAVHLAESRIVPLADEQIETVEVTRDGRWAVGRDDSNFVSDWKPRLADYYRIDTRTGEKIQFLRGHERTYGLSPDSRYFLYWLGGHFWAYRLGDGLHANLTGAYPLGFENLQYDHPGEKPPYGVAGWSADGRHVLLNLRYDLWLQPLDGSRATNLTGGRGHRDEIRFRYVQTDPEERSIDLEEPLLLSAFGEWTKKAGFFRIADGELQEIVWEDKRFGRLEKAEMADRYLYTVETFREFPDLWVSDGDFSQRERITEANPQQEEYIWGRRILIDYTNDDGTPLQGILAIPDTYEEGQRLPMIVRFYEKDSHNLHQYSVPVFSNRLNQSAYVSNGYLVLLADIHFRVGSSHSDMLECVEAATRKVVEMGYVDPTAIGLQGGSYSGGGAAYIATRSDMFAAVAHRAAPINLVSEFNQLFKGSGQNNHSYDIYGQGRYGTNPYDDFQLYWDQSPISGVEDMNTPVLYLHGTADGSVNWEQGLEWYNSLRFLGKPIIWLSYPDEGHSLGRLENQIDFQFRMRQFFDHYLKGAPAPEWMTRGVSYLEKDRHLREFAPKVFERPDTAGGRGGREQ
jgi:dipeptidyl aminopeptidase/acylaminoacyl peptidase